MNVYDLSRVVCTNIIPTVLYATKNMATLATIYTLTNKKNIELQFIGYILSNHSTATGSMRLCCSITTSTY
jgi:hypothetical protein